MDRNSQNLAKAFVSAVEQHKAGDLGAAETIYREILRQDPTHVDAIHMLGMIAYQQGQFPNAIRLINEALRHCPNSAAIYSNLGSVHIAYSQPDAAIAALRKALALDPSMALAYNNLGNALRIKMQELEAVSAYMKCIEINPSFTDAYANLGAIYYKNGNLDLAKEYFSKTIELNPEHASAQHMLAAINGETTSTAPAEHVRQLFDDYAGHFEQHLTQELSYSMPALIRTELSKIAGNEKQFSNAIDLGCGTGLAGQQFRATTHRLTGIDLSLRMVEKTRERGIYNVLHVGGILDWLDHTHERYDLFLCADVFPYIGDISPLFRSVQNCALPGAYFAFSTESTDENDFVLRITGRYAHASAFIRKTAAETGFSVITLRSENLRKQKGTWIPGDLVVLQAQNK